MSLWRIILHWTAGAPGIVEVERDSYHFIVGRDGVWTSGTFKPEDNIPPLGNHYAQHTRAANSYAIGVALDAMHDAKEGPFSPGPFPVTWEQLDSMAEGVAGLCRAYDVPVTRDRVLSHAEVQRTLGIKQNAKWDITWLPGMAAPGDPIDVGDRLREMIRSELRAPQHAPVPREKPLAPETSPIPPEKPTFTPQEKPESWWQRVWDSWFR